MSSVLVLNDVEGKMAASTGVSQMRSLVQELVVLKGGLGDVTDGELLKRVGVVLCIRERTTLDGGFFDRLPSLKLILQTGGHAYHVDQEEMKRRGIVMELGRSATAPLAAVAELTIGLMLACMRGLVWHDARMRKGGWDDPAKVGLGRVL